MSGNSSYLYRTIAVMLVAGSFGCKPPPDPPGYGVLVVAVQSSSVEGTELEGLSSIATEILRVDVVHRTDATDPSTEQIVTVLETPVEVEVVTPSETPRELARFEVPVGTVYQIRFITPGGNIVINHESHDIRIPSGGNTGLKIVPEDDPFVILEREISAVLAKFDPDDRIVHNRGTGYKLKPTIPAIPVPEEELFGVPLDELLVHFVMGTPQPDIDDFLTDHGAYVKHHLMPQSGFYLLGIPPEMDIYEVGEDMLRDSRTDLVSANWPVPPPRVFSEGTEENQAAINMPAAWDTTIGSHAVVVGLVDSGVVLDSLELANNIWINMGEIPEWVFSVVGDRNSDGDINYLDLDTNDDLVVSFTDINTLILDSRYTSICDASFNPNPAAYSDFCEARDLVDGDDTVHMGWEDDVDNDGNGLKDDVVGWNWEYKHNLPTSQGSVAPAHGNMVAALLCAVGDNGIEDDPIAGMVGVAPNILVMPLVRRGLNVDGTVGPVLYAARQQADIILYEAANAYGLAPPPLGCTYRQLNRDNFNFARDKGNHILDRMVEEGTHGGGASDFPSLFVAPMPNCPLDYDGENILAFIGEYDRPFLISETTVNTEMQTMGGYGINSVDIAVPGESNKSLGSDGTVTFDYLRHGTSGGGGILAGVAALVLSANPEYRGNPCALKWVLLNNAAPDVATPGRVPDDRFLDAEAAVNLSVYVDPTSCPE